MKLNKKGFMLAEVVIVAAAIAGILVTLYISLNKIRAEQIINYSALPFENESSSVALASNKSPAEYKKLIKAHRD